YVRPPPDTSTLSLHDALPISFTEAFALLAPYVEYLQVKDARFDTGDVVPAGDGDGELAETVAGLRDRGFTGFASLEPHLTDQTSDRKSTRLNSSHVKISYAVF